MTDPHLPHALRILARDIHCEDGIATQCIREAADEIERLRSQPCPYVVGTTTKFCVLSAPALTNAEREAVEYFSQWCIGPSKRLERYAAALRGLLERTAR